MATLCFDYDYVLYAAGFVGETRSIRVVHRASGDEYEFANRTAFFGHWKTKSGGWLSEYNAAKSEGKRRAVDEFDITDVQTPEPLSNCLHTAKRIIEGIVETLGADSYYGYSGRGKTFREDVSTVIQYKGQRKDSLRPVHLDALREYLVKHHSCTVVETIEADDACSIDSYTAYQKWKKSRKDSDKLVLVAVDKDALGTACHLYNPNEPEKGIDSYEGFGRLYLNEKGAVKGRGRMWLYQQVLNGDDADNYFANSASDMSWGEKSAYALLKDCKNDKEAFEALVKGYKTLYPQPKTITGWRGDTLDITWLTMLQENFTLAHMLRHKEDKVDVVATMKKLGVEFED